MKLFRSAVVAFATLVLGGFSINSGAADKTLAWIPKSTDSTFWLAVKAGAEKAGAELGYEVLYVGVQDQTNIAGQVNLVHDMVTQKKLDTKSKVETELYTNGFNPPADFDSPGRLCFASHCATDSTSL